MIIKLEVVRLLSPYRTGQGVSHSEPIISSHSRNSINGELGYQVWSETKNKTDLMLYW